MLKNQVRLISGQFRHRLITFPAIEGLRPSLDFTRETLFNWLTPVIANTTCLDLFAGSGALGFEALSRGAKKVIFIDQNPEVINALKENAKKLEIAPETAEFYLSSAENYLKQSAAKFNLIFLDPPYHKPDLLTLACHEISQKKLLRPNGYLYIEKSKASSFQLPAEYKIFKHKQTKAIEYFLVECF